jgi:hypothetical protein
MQVFDGLRGRPLEVASERTAEALITADPGASWYAGPARSKEDVIAARHLHTRRYAEAEYIRPQDGIVFDDGWMAQRRWVVVALQNDVVACGSLISPTETLPTLKAFDIDADSDIRLSECWRHHRLVEVSALCRDPRYRPVELIRGYIYRAIWQELGRAAGCDQWLTSMSWQRYDQFRRMPFPLELLGRTAEYYGGPSVAFVVDMRLARLALALRDPYFLAWMDGLHDDYSALIHKSV